MRKIRVREIEDGMVLAQDVEDSVGRTLLNRGDTLRAHFVAKLESWGISELTVEGSLAEEMERLKAPAAGLPRRSEADIEAHLAAKFAGVAGNPLMDELRLIAKKHLMRMAVGGPRWRRASQ